MKALILLADGVEEIEAVVPMDILHRAGWSVTAAGLHEGAVTAAHGTRLGTDRTLAGAGIEDYDALIIPGGGGGVNHLRNDPAVRELVRAFDRAKKTIAAICAGPLVLHDAGILKGHETTCYPSVAKAMTDSRHRDRPVVVSGHIVTSRAAGTAMAFALALVALKNGPAKARAVAEEICADVPPFTP
jgi:4-methyl-5(b-hydroxyethyl)-thiazole monophosphate biosynthesis